jgi:hypothetical protein
MCSAFPKAGRSKKRPFFRSKVFSEQIRNCFVYHPMKLLILALLAVVVLAAAGRHATRRDCFWQWRDETRERAVEVREQAREAREQAREQVREFRLQQRDQIRAFREQAREERDRIRREIRENMRWGYTY